MNSESSAVHPSENDSHPFDDKVTAVVEGEPPPIIIIASGALGDVGTSSSQRAQFLEEIRRLVLETHTTTEECYSVPLVDVATPPKTQIESTRKAISELRRISGLTWEQLGRLFGVSRRSVHFWASGMPLNAANEERLMKILDVIRFVDRGDVRSNRIALFEGDQGQTAFDHLIAGGFEQARDQLGRGLSRREPSRQDLSPQAKNARKPFRPDELSEAKHDRIHQEVGAGRIARTVRNNQRGNS